MAAHFYRIGQHVRIVTMSYPRVSGTFKVLALMPQEHGDNHYRVRVANGTQERMVNESQISSLERLD